LLGANIGLIEEGLATVILFNLLIVVAVALFFFFGRKIPDVLRPGGPGSGPPTHPLPVTSSIETSRGSGDPDAEPGDPPVTSAL